MFKVPNKHRLINHPQLGSDDSYGNNGFFTIPHPKIANYIFQAQVSDGMGWEHVSISLIKEVNVGRLRQPAKWIKQSVERCPTWEEMCWIKDLFWDKTDCVIQYHPPDSDYVSYHPYCLHLWRPTDQAIPIPETFLVGPDSAIKNLELTK